MDGVAGVHDFQVWSIISGVVSLSAHVERGERRSPALLLSEFQETLTERFDIRHCTLQIEPAGFEEEGAEWRRAGRSSPTPG